MKKDDQFWGVRMSGTHGVVKGSSLSPLLVSQAGLGCWPLPDARQSS